MEAVDEVVVELYLGCGHGTAVEHGLPVGLECAQLGKGHGVYAVDRAAVAGLVKVREGAVEVGGRGCRGGCRGGLPPAVAGDHRMQPTGEDQLDKPVGEQRPLNELRPPSLCSLLGPDSGSAKPAKPRHFPTRSASLFDYLLG